MINELFTKTQQWIVRFTIVLLRAGDEVLIGGQAVFEGVMMRSPRSYSIAVRKADQSIVTKKDYLPAPAERQDSKASYCPWCCHWGRLSLWECEP
jgi:hypothetical protein